MSATSVGRLSANSRKAFAAGFLGWTFDAFDFFVLTYVLSQLAKEFQRPVTDIALMLTASLVMRPVGATLFGMLGDRYGRRRPLMVNILFNSCVEVLSGMAPSYQALLLLRVLFGIGMGGVWGLGALLAMESVPAERRGTFSGILQEGYAVGNLLAAVAFWTVFPHWGWRPMLFLSVVPALITVGILSTVKEKPSKPISSEAHWADYFRTIRANGKRLLYLCVLMSTMGFLSHGAQDLYPTFLQQGKQFTPSLTAIMGVIAMIGAIIGGTIGGHFSDRHGRRWTMITAEICALLLVPLFVLSKTFFLIGVGGFLMQFMVQAAWGVIPAHINELIPAEVRALLPGLSYQVGILVASAAPYLEAKAAHSLGYGPAIGGVLTVVIIVGVIVIALGPEARKASFVGQEAR